MRMTRRLFSLFFLTLVLGTAGLQAACSESQSKTASNDSATEEQAGADESQDSGNTQVAEADTESQPADDAASSGDGDGASGKPYDVSCDDEHCVANQAVVTGYEKYHAHCHTCHGPNGVGSTFAPSLVDRLEDLNQGEFTAIVANGKKRFDSTTGTYSVMPAWKENPDVMSHVGQLWAYLKARSDEALPAVSPDPK